MAEPEVRVGSLESSSRDIPQDIEMGGDDNAEVDEALGILEGSNGGGGGGSQEEDQEAETETVPKLTFLDYLRSPVIEIAVGSGPTATLLTAHQALLARSPFFAVAISAFSSAATSRRVEFPSEDLDAMGAFLQFLYTEEYFPRKIGDGGLESYAAGEADGGAVARLADDGEHLLRHARIYTLAEKLGVSDLKALAHSKVHRVTSSVKGEIEYARYVYANTPKDDVAIRRPIASFWGQRSHVLRHDAEEEFRKLCLDFPDFGFDVLSFVLDQREKRGGRVWEEEVTKSGRKRARNQ